MTLEPSSQYLPVAAGGVPENGKEGKPFSQSQQTAGGLPKAPFSRAAGAGWGRRTGLPEDHMGRKAGSPAAPALLVIPNHTGSKPCFNLLNWLNTRAAGRSLGPLIPAADDKAYAKGTIIHPRGDSGGLCLGIGSQLPASSRQSLKHGAVCQQFCGDLFVVCASDKTSSGGRRLAIDPAGPAYGGVLDIVFQSVRSSPPFSPAPLGLPPSPPRPCGLFGLTQREMCPARAIMCGAGVAPVLLRPAFHSISSERPACSFRLPRP